ncbi:mucin-5AC isoform X4 [Drosophila nasuta]|uniref:mucin-5AC isoform X4 n=1 Tax=Drosophila nasuta TaxID=42062 RepID=UPI00295E7658|nr:mucin-5AC isoform X4 [Drosophila nasuta]
MHARNSNSRLRSRSAAGVTATVTFALLLTLALLRIDIAAGRPDVRPSPFALELQPPLLEPAGSEGTEGTFNGKGGERAIDSYGNPIDALRPIDTPDGRKVVSAQGVQFEIPNYASGITEIRKPADDLLPPHIAPGLTTTTTPAPVDVNPFDSATLPPWLQDFDYPDVGPGVPYNPDNFKEPETSAFGQQQPGGSKPTDFQPHGFASSSSSKSSSTTAASTAATTATTATSTIAPAVGVVASAFPSKVTLTLPGNVDVDDATGATDEPQLVLIPPAGDEASSTTTTTNNQNSDNSNQNPTTNSITHFAARFDAPAPAPAPAPASNSISGQDFQPQTQFGSNLNANDNQKVEYTKSDEGKVISTPVNTVRKDGQGTFPAAPAPAPAPSNNAGKYTGGFGAPAGLLRPLNAGKPDIYVAGNEHDFAAKANRARPTAPTPAPGRYTGGFGAPSGVLSPQNAPRPFQQAQPQQPQQPQQQQHHQQPQQLAGAASSHQLNRFGGPPGVLVPFDNVQRAPQQ